MPAVMWFRRDLRLSDNPALVAASHAARDTGDRSVLGVYVLDPALLRPSGAPRVAVLYRTLRVLDAQLGGNLVVRHGDPAVVLPKLCRETGAESVHCAADFGPYGSRRDEAVAEALGDVGLHRSGSPYAVEPGSVVNGSGENFKVYSAFYRAWREHGWSEPARSVRPAWAAARSDGVPDDPDLPAGLRLPDVGEAAARRAWRGFLAGRVESYADQRDRPDLDRTSHMSVHLKWGTIHPRSMLADLSDRHETYRRELAWREFYADVLYARPDSARQYYHRQLQGLPFATGRLAEERLAA